MTTKILYSTPCSLTIYFDESCDLASAYFREQFNTLQDAIDTAKLIFEIIYPATAERILIWDTNTGEVLAECSRDYRIRLY